MSATSDLKKTRAKAGDPIKLGQWHADFTKMQKYADSKNVPLFGVWSNGEACSHCTAFEKCLLDANFKSWQKTSGVALWLGLNGDKAPDGYEGKGFQWARKNKLEDFPFVRLYWKKGKVDICKSGDDWTGGIPNAGAKGAKKLVAALKAALKDYCPNCTASATTTPTVAKTPLVALPCAANDLETALHRVCDSGTIYDWMGTVKYSGGKLVLEAEQ